MLIKITNSFHNSEAVCRPSDNGYLSPSQVRRLRKKLCGIEGCTCGDCVGARPAVAEEEPDGGAFISEK